MPIPIYQVDAFTRKPFSGNPAAVVLLSEQMPDEWMLALAQEMNLSETAFLLPEADGYRLRWFTPKLEVSLCGHATLASGHVLAERDELLSGTEVKFYTLSGLLTAARHGGKIELNFPALPTSPLPPRDGLLETLGLQAEEILAVEDSNGRALIEVDGEKIVRQLKPDFNQLAKDTGRGVIVTSRSADDRYDFISRFFASYAGIDEDPVTGSAHCCLAPYWATQLGKTTMSAYQASARGGELEVELAGERVFLRGNAVIVFTGELRG
jgi:PhzF family phenazine biosynthesis protein